MSDYKSYQQVINLSVRPLNKAKKQKVTKKQTQKGSPKIRTKTGCLTCRKRKKKCDENVVDGKCQGCSRNFLDCTWPVLPTLKQQHDIENVERRSSISSDCSDCSIMSNQSMDSVSTVATSRSINSSPKFHSYPSPRSPIPEEDMHIKLPPLRINQGPQKLQPARSLPSLNDNKFIITSLENDRLCSLNN